MHIGIEAERANHAQKTGVEHYAQQLIVHLAQIDRHNRYTLYLRTAPQAWFLELPKNFAVKVMPFPKFWTQVRLSWEMLRRPPDVLFIPASALPFIHPKKSVITIHDMNWKVYPETDTWFMRNYLRWSYWYITRHAWRIIAISESTGKDLLKFYDMAPGKIVTVHLGYEQVDIANAAPSPAVALQLPEKYVLFLSTLQPRKNLQRLIEAFRKLKAEHPDLPHKLVVVGKPGWKYEPILVAIERNRNLVIYLNHVSDADKWAVFRRASAFAMPTLYEGFGMWILEAFQAQVPLVISNVASLPEIAADAAVYCEPLDVDDIKRALQQVLMEKSLAERLVARGSERLKQFSWDKCARETLEVINGI
jgi:glycosyltransferase involved in cell wall biosynthesis